MSPFEVPNGYDKKIVQIVQRVGICPLKINETTRVAVYRFSIGSKRRIKCRIMVHNIKCSGQISKKKRLFDRVN